MRRPQEARFPVARAIVALAAFVLVAVAAPAVPAGDARYFFVGEDFDGRPVEGWVTLSDEEHFTWPCPAPTPCVNGPHVRGRWGPIAHGFVFIGLGVYNSNVASTGDTVMLQKPSLRTFTCAYAGGVAGVRCEATGEFPPYHRAFNQECNFVGPLSGYCFLIHW